MNKSHDEDQEKIIDLANDRTDLIFFIIMFFVVLFLLAPGFSSYFKLPVQCAAYNGNFNACVDAQQQGKGCAWYGSCNKCGAMGTEVGKVCK